MEYRVVDVVIPAYKPGEELEELIRRLASQKYPVHKLILMNTEEEFWKAELEEKFPFMEVHHLSRKEFDHGGTRKLAASFSDAEILMYMTQDALPSDRSLVGNLVKALEQDEKIAAAYARQLPKADCRFLERYTRSFNYPEESSVKWEKNLQQLGIKTFFCSNVCAAYKKDVFDKLGGFTERTLFNEDMIYAGNLIKSGYGIAYAADARVFHSHNYSPLQQFHRNFDLGVSQAEHPEIFSGISSEGEGIALVKKSAIYLIKKGRAELLLSLVLQSAGKYIGYLAGKNFRKLPKAWVKKFTMMPSYWEQES